MYKSIFLAGAICLGFGAQCADAREKPVNEQRVASGGSQTFQAEIWVDNWFRLWINGRAVAEDSTAYRTERSFNAERITFTADRPLTIGLELRDFMENDTGLEYIGTRKQQMGDGGAIAQFRDAAGRVIAVTDSNWSCKVAHHAPVQTACARDGAPTEGKGACASQTTPVDPGWAQAGAPSGGWSPAQEYSARQVRPKDGYDGISWDRSARLIWGPDLERDNWVMCRITLPSG